MIFCTQADYDLQMRISDKLVIKQGIGTRTLIFTFIP